MAKVLRLRTHDDFLARVKAAAGRRGISASDFAREAILKHLETEEARHSAA